MSIKTTLTTRNQVSIPKSLCDRLELKPGTRIDWDIIGDRLIGCPLPARAWTRLIGSRKGKGSLVDCLLKHRHEDREHEQRQEEVRRASRHGGDA